MKKNNLTIPLIIISVIAIVAIIFAVSFYRSKGKQEKEYKEAIAAKDTLITDLQAANRQKDDKINEQSVELSKCYSDKNQESIQRNRYERELRYFKEDCETELQNATLRNRIDNDNELGKLLSELGQSESLSDAGRVLLPK